MRYERWNVLPPRPQARQEMERLGIRPLTAAVLAARGLDGAEGAALLRGAQAPLHDPLLMADMDKAVARVRLAQARGEQVAVYGDYDVDGITSTCLLTECLRGLGLSVTPYIPDRLQEGYGLNREAVARLAGRGVGLIVTVDCGITAVEEVAFAASLGVDVVITDHHRCKEQLPPAAAVVDPRRADCPYPFKELAGVGVALKLALALRGPEGAQEVLARWSDLAAVGTIADVMEMTGENRTLVRLGLAALERRERLGLAVLLREAGLGDKAVTSSAVGYTLAPRINAAGRMGRADTAVELFLTRDAHRAEELARGLCALNRERQSIESDIFESCVQRLDRAPQQGALVLADGGWHQGVVGIVASRLSERYACPAFMVCLSEGMGKGSCRSWGGVNLFSLLSECGDLLEGFGGHALAAGFTVREENLPALTRRLRQGVERQRAGEEEGHSALEIDALLSPGELTVEEVEGLDALEPYGQGNPRPVFALAGAVVHGVSQVGRGRHLKLRLEAEGTILDAIFFSADAGEWGLVPGSRVDAAFSPQINEFRGMRSVQLHLLDLRPARTRAQNQQALYERFARGETLTPSDAGRLLPRREEFAQVWRYLRRQEQAGPVIEATGQHLSRGIARASGCREEPARTMVCLDVLAERGLITLSRREDRLRITLLHPQEKVDLEASGILIRLHAQAGGPEEENQKGR